MLRLEGLVLFVGALVVYFDQGFGWLLLVVLSLAPDLSFAGYLAGPRVGAWFYNALHTTVGPTALAIIGVLADSDWCVQLALIWLAHIGIDRLLGYGLKYPTGFKDTHLQRVKEALVKTNRSVPEAAVIPELPYPDVRAAVDWLTRAFGFQERLQIGDHRAQLMYEGGAVIAIQGKAPGSTLLVRVDDADAHHTRAAEAGATILSEPEDFPYGERQYSAVDPGGHRWTFSQSVDDIDPATWGGTLKA